MAGQKKTSRQKAQAHARRAYHCTCGDVVHGNGARWSHGSKHDRARDGHRYVNREVWQAAARARGSLDSGVDSGRLAVDAQDPEVHRAGAIIGWSCPCACGHSPEEHGRDARYPSSTSCTECDCIAFEADAQDDS